jgi:hypothetical protein
MLLQKKWSAATVGGLPKIDQKKLENSFFVKLPPYNNAGFDLTTHSSSLLPKWQAETCTRLGMPPGWKMGKVQNNFISRFLAPNRLPWLRSKLWIFWFSFISSSPYGWAILAPQYLRLEKQRHALHTSTATFQKFGLAVFSAWSRLYCDTCKVMIAG